MLFCSEQTPQAHWRLAPGVRGAASLAGARRHPHPMQTKGRHAGPCCWKACASVRLTACSWEAGQGCCIGQHAHMNGMGAHLPSGTMVSAALATYKQMLI